MSRGSRKHSRAWIGVGLAAAAMAALYSSGVAAALDATPCRRGCGDCIVISKMDYVMMASISDSPQWLAMAGYLSAARARSEACKLKKVGFDRTTTTR
jgi:Protein of unknown function (DUF3649)